MAGTILLLHRGFTFAVKAGGKRKSKSHKKKSVDELAGLDF